MIPFEFLAFLTLVLFSFYSILGNKSKPKNYPPGPWAFPLLGHLPVLITNGHKKLLIYAQKFGAMFAAQMGEFPAVIINDAKTIRAAFSELDCSGRPSFPAIPARSNGIAEGVIMTDGTKWAEQRRFMLRTLRDFGFGKKSMEGALHEEIKELIQGFGKDVGSPVSTQNRFNGAVLNALWALVAGERFKQDDPELQLATKHMTTLLQQHSPRNTVCNLFPTFTKYFPKLSGLQNLVSIITPIIDFMKKPIAEHEATFLAGQPRDFIDVYLEEIRKTTDPNSSFYKQRGESSLRIVLLDLFVAGADTTSTTLSWTFLYLAKFPEKQAKLQAEIANVVGDNRLPSLADRPNMPYTEAVLHEVMRRSSLFYIGLPHRSVNDVEIGGFTIPKDTMLISNLYAVHHDPKVWGDPENFRPERFLNKGGAFEKHESFMAFSAGKRVCLGETLARDQLFLFTTSLFQAFTVGPETTAEELSTEAVMGLVLSPMPHKLILTSRI